MLKVELKLWDGQDVKLTLPNYRGDDSVIWRELTYSEVGYSPIDVREIYVKEIAYCGIVNLSPFRNIEYLEFEHENFYFRCLIMSGEYVHTIKNIPDSVNILRCSPYATITNFDRLLGRDVDIKMETGTEHYWT